MMMIKMMIMMMIIIMIMIKTYCTMQWAAVRTQRRSMRVPPHEVRPRWDSATTHGYFPAGTTWPSTTKLCRKATFLYPHSATFGWDIRIKCEKNVYLKTRR